MDHETLSDEHLSQPASVPDNQVLADVGRAVTGHVAMTPTSLARRCDDIISLIDDLLGAPAREVRRSPRIEPDMVERGAGSDDVAA